MSKQFFDQGTYLLGLFLYCNILGKECTKIRNTIQIIITIAQRRKLLYQLHILAKN